MPLFDEKMREQLKNVLKKMKDPISLAFFTQEFECRSCADTHAFVDETASLTGAIKLTVYDFVKDRALAERFGVDKVPAIVVNDRDNEYLGVKFYGLPGGYEINSFMQALIEVSGVREPLPGPVLARIAAIQKEVRIQVFVSLTCPYCPAAVSAAHRLAMESGKIGADMIDAALYPHLVQKYQVSGVPLVVINETKSLTGALQVEDILKAIEQV